MERLANVPGATLGNALTKRPTALRLLAIASGWSGTDWRKIVIPRSAFVYPPRNLEAKTVSSQALPDRLAIRIGGRQKSQLVIAPNLTLLNTKGVCHGSPLHVLSNSASSAMLVGCDGCLGSLAVQ